MFCEKNLNAENTEAFAEGHRELMKENELTEIIIGCAIKVICWTI